MKDIMTDEPSAPKVVDRNTFQAELDAIAAARRRLPMVEMDGVTVLIGDVAR